MRTLRLLAASVRDFGLGDTFDRLPAYVVSPLSRSRLRRRKLAELSADGFDAAHGTDTAAILVGSELGTEVTGDGHVVPRYETSSEAAIRIGLDSLAVDHSRFTFVDLGCGKGKPLLVAASYAFRRLVGVDVSPVCIAVARRNVARYGPERIDPSRVELICADARDFAFPDEPLVVYLFNPFPQAVLEQVVANLERSLAERPREACVVFLNPDGAGPFSRSPLFARVPTIADRMPLAGEGVRPYERAAVFVARARGGRTGATGPPCRH